MKHTHTFRKSLLAMTCTAILFSGCDLKNMNSSINSIEEKESNNIGQVKPPNKLKIKPTTASADQVVMEQAIAKNYTALSPITHRSFAKNAAIKSAYFPAPVIAPIVPENTENYLSFDENAINLVAEKPVSTFSIDVDTAAYSNLRRLLMQGKLPPKDAVKTEEMINYFSYQYPSAESLEQAFSISTELAASPWNQNKKLLHIGIKGYDIDKQDIPAANLVFLVDVSGSMQSPNKLGLVKSSLKLLLKQLDKDDKVSLVVYAGAAGVVLEPTAANEKIKIEQAIDELTAGGSTNGEAGIISAYNMAQQGFIKDGINRVIIASDGDMNVGRYKIDQLKELIENKRKSGIALTTLGFGSGNYNYALMEQLADVGDGNAAYIDNLLEAQKVLVNEMSSTLLTIAKDVKIQIEFSPLVKEYRLIGYENRMLKREDFNNDKVDAGDIGAGHTVTAIYEITLADAPGSIDELRYSTTLNYKKSQLSSELAFLKIRYKHPQQSNSLLVSKIIKKQDIIKEFKNSSDNFKFSASVAAFGQLLKGGKYMENFTYSDIIKLARQSKGVDKNGYRAEFIKLVGLAKDL